MCNVPPPECPHDLLSHTVCTSYSAIKEQNRGNLHISSLIVEVNKSIDISEVQPVG